MTEKEEKKSEGRMLIASRSAPLKGRPKEVDSEDPDED